jgi:tricorn protease
MGGDYRPSPAWFQGMLGADLAWSARARRWVIRRIPRGDSWVEGAASPLAAPGLDVREGDHVLAVDGRAVDADLSPSACLVHQAGRAVVLTLQRPGAAKRRVTVKTLRSEFALRYRDWVETNRARVHAETGGRVGYVHVPNMGPVGYAEFHRYYKQEFDHLGLIVDVRWNGGGHVSQLLLEKLARKRIGYGCPRWMAPESYPGEAPMGPMVALTNENAGSDGDIFSHSFKLLGLGPLIGKRTWGGVVGIWPRHALVDGTITTQAEFAHWFHDVEWGVENYGTDPDVEVEIRPQDWAAGRDPQLERAIREVEAIIRRVKPRVPDLSNKPGLAPPRLPRP